MTIGEKIYKLRQEKGVSQETMALDLNVSRQAISKWETDQSIPDLDKIKLLSEYFSVSIDDLVNNNNLENAKDSSNFKDNLHSKANLHIETNDTASYETNINSAKRLSKLFIKTSIALTIYRYILTFLTIIFQKNILLIRYSNQYEGFIFPYVYVIFTTIATVLIVLFGISILKKMKTNIKSIVKEIVYIIILIAGFFLLNSLYAAFAKIYLDSVSIDLAVPATYLEQILHSTLSFEILLIIGIVIEAVTRLIDNIPSAYYPMKEYKTRDSVFSFLNGLFLGIPGLIFQFIWLLDAKTDNIVRFKKMRFWYLIGFVISLIISSLAFLFSYINFYSSINIL